MLGEPDRNEAYLAYEKELKTRLDAVAKFKEDNKAEIKATPRKFRDQINKLEKNVAEWKINGPASPPRAMVLADAPTPRTPHVLLRGNPGNLGPEVPRQLV